MKKTYLTLAAIVAIAMLLNSPLTSYSEGSRDSADSQKDRQNPDEKRAQHEKKQQERESQKHIRDTQKQSQEKQEEPRQTERSRTEKAAEQAPVNQDLSEEQISTVATSMPKIHDDSESQNKSCKKIHVPITKTSNGKQCCVTAETFEHLVHRGWGH